VKITALATGGFIALGLLCYVGQLSGQNQGPGTSAQPASPAAAAPRTHIALLNLTYVIKNYEKYKHFQDEMKVIIEPFQKKDTELRQELDRLRKKAEEFARLNQTSEREKLEREGKEIQRKLEDNAAEAKFQLSKRTDNEMEILFRDVYEAANHYAASHDFDLVLHYNDAITEAEFMSAQNIARKLQTGALMPFCCPRSLDISVEVTNVLNYNMRSSTTPGTGAPGTTPAGDGH
jgi:Skp family chaperone for outer membrane proteins